ncbi:hypothetical protein HY484_03165 [Candidatus Woesearchaeota archaeon]|nr:hypothetical protein [Candidatus Woesearchaeota archaeon]
MKTNRIVIILSLLISLTLLFSIIVDAIRPDENSIYKPRNFFLKAVGWKNAITGKFLGITGKATLAEKTDRALIDTCIKNCGTTTDDENRLKEITPQINTELITNAYFRVLSVPIDYQDAINSKDTLTDIDKIKNKYSQKYAGERNKKKCENDEEEKNRMAFTQIKLSGGINYPYLIEYLLCVKKGPKSISDIQLLPARTYAEYITKCPGYKKQALPTKDGAQLIAFCVKETEEETKILDIQLLPPGQQPTGYEQSGTTEPLTRTISTQPPTHTLWIKKDTTTTTKLTQEKEQITTRIEQNKQCIQQCESLSKEAAPVAPPTALVQTTQEICNGQDDDGDGKTDEGIPDEILNDAPNIAHCRPTIKRCDTNPDSPTRGTMVIIQTPVMPQTEECNKKDDNCDGQTDEGFTSQEQCSVGKGACTRQGIRITTCTDGLLKTTDCSEKPGTPTSETCGDGIDQDCDGTDLACPPQQEQPTPTVPQTEEPATAIPPVPTITQECIKAQTALKQEQEKSDTDKKQCDNKQEQLEKELTQLNQAQTEIKTKLEEASKQETEKCTQMPTMPQECTNIEQSVNDANEAYQQKKEKHDEREKWCNNWDIRVSKKHRAARAREVAACRAEVAQLKTEIDTLKSKFDTLTKQKETCQQTQSKQDFEFVGCYNDKAERALTTFLGNKKPIEQCANLAKEKYKYFALQYPQEDNNPKTAQCFAGNEGYDKYGKTECTRREEQKQTGTKQEQRCRLYRGKQQRCSQVTVPTYEWTGRPMGDAWQNAVYTFKTTTTQECQKSQQTHKQTLNEYNTIKTNIETKNKQLNDHKNECTEIQNKNKEQIKELQQETQKCTQPPKLAPPQQEQPTTKQPVQPQPTIPIQQEICDGFDNNQDGIVDNIPGYADGPRECKQRECVAAQQNFMQLQKIYEQKRIEFDKDFNAYYQSLGITKLNGDLSQKDNECRLISKKINECYPYQHGYITQQEAQTRDNCAKPFRQPHANCFKEKEQLESNLRKAQGLYKKFVDEQNAIIKPLIDSLENARKKQKESCSP